LAEQRVIYEHAVDALFNRTLGKRLSEKAKARLKAAGLDVARIDRPVPQPVYKECLRIAMEEVYPSLEPGEAALQLGKDLATGYIQTMQGKAAAALTRMLGPRRSLPRMTQNLRSANNFVETTLKELGNGRYEVTINEHHGYPRYIEGGLVTVLPLSGAKNVRVHTLSADEHRGTYLIEWDE
jgi:uncharacterized protein (TIGR02265 family)